MCIIFIINYVLIIKMIKILHLVLYSDDVYYNQMFDILNDFYKHYENHNNKFFIKTYYYKFNSIITNDIEVIDNIIHIKGEESFIPGILEKTLIAFKYIQKEFQEDNYNYLIRSNISSIIDFNLLVPELEKNPIIYGSTNAGYFNYHDISSGIIDDIFFASGTNIIISNDGYKKLIDNLHLINKTNLDDVSIAILFKKLNISCNLLKYNKFVFMNDELNNIQNILMQKYFVYRNKNITRDIDVKQIKLITSELLSKLN